MTNGIFGREIDLTDIYSEEAISYLADEDEIEAWEEGFIIGYIKGVESASNSNKKKKNRETYWI